jgi:hypothetical protein
MINENKSLNQSVKIFSKIHEKNIALIEHESARIKSEASTEIRKGKKGRKKTTAGRVTKSKLKPISLNNSAYTQARQRLEISYIKEVYYKSRDDVNIKESYLWHGYRILIGDGTYLQLQDTENIRKEFPASISGTYPQGLLEVIIEQGSGVVYDFKLSKDKISELEILSGMIKNLPKKSLLLADDLYNCYAIFCLLEINEIGFIVHG